MNLDYKRFCVTYIPMLYLSKSPAKCRDDIVIILECFYVYDNKGYNAERGCCVKYGNCDMAQKNVSCL